MNDYLYLAPFYDVLTGNVDYRRIHAFYNEVFKKAVHTPHLLLDLCCGTGTLTFLFERDGCDVIGVDASEDMLSAAMDKKSELGSKALFLCQDARSLDLYGTVDTVICNLDSVNHFAPDDMDEIFRRISLFCEPGSLFVFDLNSEYKYKNVLADKTYSYDTDSVFCSWSSEFDGKAAEIQLDMFEKQNNGLYSRFTDNVTEYYYSDEYIKGLLKKHGFDIIGVYADFTADDVKKTSERIHYAAKKE